MRAVYQRELKSYFSSMIGYVFIAVVVFFIGVYFMANNLFYGYPRFAVSLLSVLTIFLFAVPILTMKSMAEERRGRTDQLWMTAPVSLGAVVLGKYLAMVTVLAVPTLLSCLCPLIIAANGSSSLVGDYAAILVFFLVGCVYIAVGMFLSALTESQIIAAVGTFAVLLILNLWDDLSGFFPSAVAEVLSAFSFRAPFENAAQYETFDLGGLALYLSMAAVFVFLTVQVLEKRRWGGVRAGVTALAVALAVVVNLAAGQVPANVRELDVSDNQLYEVSDTSRAFLSGLDQDVEVVVLAEPDRIDPRITKFLDRYAALSPRVSVETVDPAAHPTALTEYAAQADSLVVTCPATGKQTSVPFSDIITYTMNYASFSYQESSFDAEGQLTSAIDYVTGEASEKLYTTAGHGEAPLPQAVSDAVDKANLATGSVNLLLDGGIPGDCSLLLVNQPERDLSGDELAQVRAYLSAGGQVMVLLPQSDADLPNVAALLNEYGLALEPGFAADTQRFYQQNPYAIFPVLSADSSITAGFDSQDLVLVGAGSGFAAQSPARAMTQTDPARDTIAVEPFLSTSEGGVAVDADGQTQGTYLLGAVSTEATDGGEARLTVLSASSLIDEGVLSTFSVVNLSVFLNALTAGFDTARNISVPAKSLAVTYNTIPSAGMWSLLFTLILPVGVLVYGLVHWARRRKR